MRYADCRAEREGLLLKYVDLCNQVMESNCHRYPFAQIWREIERKLNNVPLAVTLFEDDEWVCASYALMFADGKLKAWRWCDILHDDMNKGVKLSCEYLEHVLQYPEKYVQKPALLDWQWLLPEMQNV
jgi:hypothetical protein